MSTCGVFRTAPVKSSVPPAAVVRTGGIFIPKFIFAHSKNLQAWESFCQLTNFAGSLVHIPDVFQAQIFLCRNSGIPRDSANLGCQGFIHVTYNLSTYIFSIFVS